VLCLSVLALVSVQPVVAQFKPKLSRLNPLARKEAAPTRSPTFNDRVLEITDARVDQLLKGYASEAAALAAADKEIVVKRAAYEEENRKHPARLREYEKSHQAWQGCQDQVVKPAEAKAKAQIEQSQDEITGGDQAAFERKMEEVKQRMEAAKAAGDMNEVMRLADSLSRNMGMKSGQTAMQAASDLQAAASRCGPEPERPDAPVPPAADTPNLETAGSRAAGLNAEQYAILRERTQAALDEDGRVQVPSSSWAFSSGELSVLEKRGVELSKAYAPIREHGH
jgi:hypothetical protein